MKKRFLYFSLVLFLLIIDQLTKAVISRSISLHTSLNLISGFFNLTHIRNKGAIFGLFSRSNSSVVHILMMLVSLAALSFIMYYFLKSFPGERLLIFSLSLILAGALGNLIDRIFKGYVIDFLDFYVKDWHWPTFNFADFCITIGAVILIFIFFFERRPKCFPS